MFGAMFGACLVANCDGVLSVVLYSKVVAQVQQFKCCLLCCVCVLCVCVY